MKAPDNLKWDHPGFPSFMVFYGESSGTFYSTNDGINLFLVIDNYQYTNTTLWIIALILLFFKIFISLVAQIDYVIGIVGGLVFAHYFWIISGRLSPYVDKQVD